MNCKEAAWLDAYADRELDLSRQLEIEQHLKNCSDCGGRLKRRTSTQDAFRESSLRYDPPEGLEGRIRSSLRPPAAASPFSWRPWWGGFLTAAVVTSALFILSPHLARPVLENKLVQEVTASHVRSLLTHHLTDVEASDQHVVKPWFNGRVDFSPEVRDFADQGFPLAGARVDYLDHRPVAALVYHRARHPIQLFIWPLKSGESLPLKSFGRTGYHLYQWADRGMTYWLISDLNFKELRDFAELVRAQ